MNVIFQMYWPSWWKLWPSLSKVEDDLGRYCHYYLCIGPFQWMWIA